MLIHFNDYIKRKFHNKEMRDKAIERKDLFIKKFNDNISIDYIKNKLFDSKNKILIYNLDKDFKDYNNIGIIIYRIILYNRNKIRIYIPIISVKKKLRGCGYGKIILDEFIGKFRDKHKGKQRTIEIVLLSLGKSIQFYHNYGFEIDTFCYEKKENTTDTIPMKLIID